MLRSPLSRETDFLPSSPRVRQLGEIDPPCIDPPGR
jgi:hypothetical protein